MWYPFYYKQEPTGNFLVDWLMVLVELPAVAIIYTVIWFLPAAFTNSLCFEAWISGLIGFFVVPFLIVHFCDTACHGKFNYDIKDATKIEKFLK